MARNGTTKAKNRISGVTEGVTARKFEIQPLRIARMAIKIRGSSPLMIQAFSKKAKDEMIEAQTTTKPKAKKKPPRKIKEEIQNAKILDAKKKPVVPAIWLKCAIVTAAMRYYEVRSSFLKGVLRVCGNTTDKATGDEAITLKFKRESVDERIVRLQDMRRTAFVRYRPVYHDWSCEFLVEWDQSAIDADAIVEFIRRAGWSIGLGEYRREKGGEFGSFEIEGSAAK